MNKKNTLYNHKKYYNKPEDRKVIPRYEINSGMLITFRYPGRDVKPLVFVMDTDEYVSPASKKSFSGLNLNYLTISELNDFFIRMLNRVGWELDRQTQRPKVDFWDDEETGLKPEIIYESLVKKRILNKRNCWRKYKHSKVTQVEQVTFNFRIPPLDQLPLIKKVGTIKKSDMLKLIKDKDEN